MKTKIKRHSRSVISVLLSVCMLISCMTVGLIATDAANVTDSETVGGSDNTITDYFFKGSFDSWTKHYVNGEGKAYIDISNAGTYEFVLITGNGDQKRVDHTFTKSSNFNCHENGNSNFKIQVATPGTYVFQTSVVNNNSVTITLTFPSGGGSTSTDWKLLDGNTWDPGTSTKKFTLNSATGYYEYSQYFSTGNNYFRVSNGSTVYCGSASGNTDITAGGSAIKLVQYNGGEKSFHFTPESAGTYIVQIDATNNKVRIQAATKYNVTWQTPTNGELSSSLSSATAGESVTITATPNSGYSLKSLVLTYDDTDHDVTNSVVGNSYTFAMPAFAVTAAATFTNSRTIYFNNYVAQWSKVFVYTKTAGGEEGNGPAPGLEMTRVGTSSIYSAEIPEDTNYIVFSGSGGATNEGAIITYKTDTNYGNALPSDYSEYKATAANGSTGEWSAHSDRNNVYTVTPGTSVTTNNNLYYNGLTATLYDYYTDGEYNNGNANWINGIKQHQSGQRTAEYSVDDGKEFKWNPYKTFNAALSSYAAENSVPYPLYFGNLNIRDSGNNNSEGNLNRVGGDGTTVYTNWADKISNSVRLMPNGTSVTGLASATENNSTIAHSNGAAMAMFDEDWLSQENSTGNPLATILHSSAFPVRKINKSGTMDYVVLDKNNRWDGENIWAWMWEEGKSGKWVKFTKDNDTGFYLAPAADYDKMKIFSLNADPADVNAYGNPSIKYSTNAVESDITITKADHSIYRLSAHNSGSFTTDPASPAKIIPDYTLYEYDSTGGLDNAYIQNVKTGDHTATMEYSTTEKAYSADAGGGSTAGFYPFDNMKASDNSHTSDINNVNLGNNRPHDLGFGMKLEIPFSLNPNGTVDSTANGIAQTFNFSGDDDLWVYIDGHLVLDLGGAHKKAEGSINFKNKTATSTTKFAAASAVGPSTNNSDYTATQTYSNNFSSWFDTGSETLHTMTIYYMERGMYESNLKFNFSFHAIQNLYTTEKKIRTGNINSGFYVKDATTRDPVTGMTKFEASYQYEHFNVDHKVSSTENGDYLYPAEDFNYARVEITPTPNGDTKVTHNESHVANADLVYNLTNDDRAQFNGKFRSGDYFQLKETPAANNKYSYTPTLTVYDDANNTKRNDVTSAGANTFRFRFHEPDPTSLKTVNIRAQLENIMKQHDLKITKSIGEREDQNTEFTFRVTFNFDYEGSGTDNGYEGYPLFISSDKVNNKVQMYSVGEGSSTKHGYFKIRAGETITIPKIPEGADIKIEEDLTDINEYTYGGMSSVGATATEVSGENAVTMVMGESDINVTALNNDNTVKATIRVKYAPTYYGFEEGTGISQDTYTNTSGSTYTNTAVVTQCQTSFTDGSNTSTTEISADQMVETDTRNASDSFEVTVANMNAGGKLFIGWYDEDGNRYNDDDATQHSTTASAAKDEDRIFEARFIDQPTYRIDYAVPTRLWGDRIYKVFGKVTNDMISNTAIGYDSNRTSTSTEDRKYYITGSMVEANKPSEDIFLKNITWDSIDTSSENGKTTTEYKVGKKVTHNSSGDAESVTETGTVTYDLYRSTQATAADKQVTVDLYYNCNDLTTRTKQVTCNYGESVENHTIVATNIPENKTFYRWKIETLNSLGGTADTLVTYDYSKNFNYVAYDNYKVTAELLVKEPGGTEYSPYSSKNDDDPYHADAPTNNTSVINLGLTRSHWNDTKTGDPYVPGEDDSTTYTSANTDTDRLFIDLALSYSDGEVRLNTRENCTVGFKINYWDDNAKEWKYWKTEQFSSTELTDKNRIEYFYGFKNSANNRSKKLQVQPIINGQNSGNPIEFQFNDTKFTAQG